MSLFVAAPATFIDNRRVDKAREIRRRYRQIALPVMENSSLRRALSDEQAKQLLDWGMAQLEAFVTETAVLDEPAAMAILEEKQTAVITIMRLVNDLLQPRDDDRQLLSETESAAADSETIQSVMVGDKLVRLLKNLAWLSGQQATLPMRHQVEKYRQTQTTATAADQFQQLIALLALAPFSGDKGEEE